MIEIEHRAEGGRLAGTVASQQPHHSAFSHVERDVLDDSCPPKFLQSPRTLIGLAVTALAPHALS